MIMRGGTWSTFGVSCTRSSCLMSGACAHDASLGRRLCTTLKYLAE